MRRSQITLRSLLCIALRYQHVGSGVVRQIRKSLPSPCRQLTPVVCHNGHLAKHVASALRHPCRGIHVSPPVGRLQWGDSPSPSTLSLRNAGPAAGLQVHVFHINHVLLVTAAEAYIELKHPNPAGLSDFGVCISCVCALQKLAIPS